MGLAEVPRMSTAFTDPTAGGFDFLQVDLANEYQVALRERQLATDYGIPVSAFSAGDDATDVDTWQSMQDWIEAHCTNFVNIDGRTAAEDWDGEATIDNYASFTEFKTVAGLDSSGWRRATSWSGVGAPTFSYGQAQAGDIFGYWIYEDLAKAFSALIHTQADTLPDTVERKATGYPTVALEATCAGAAAAIDAASWPAYSAYGGPSYFYRAYGLLYQVGGGADWRTGAVRMRALAWDLPPTTVVSCAIDLYAFMEKADATGSTQLWEDIDATGATENTFMFYETLALGNGADRFATTYPSAATSNPHVDSTASWCSYTDVSSGIQSPNVISVRRWDFTNSDI